MATNTGKDYRQGSVNDRIQVCDPITGICKKIDTSTNKVVGSKVGEYKGVADHSDERRNEFFNNNVDKEHK